MFLFIILYAKKLPHSFCLLKFEMIDNFFFNVEYTKKLIILIHCMIIIVPIFNMFDSLFIPFDLIIQRIVNIA